MPAIGIDEIQRLTEDKAFDIGPMRATLGVQPIPLTQGLTRTFAGPALRHIDWPADRDGPATAFTSAIRNLYPLRHGAA
jgi:hypothetical protein